MSVGQGERLSRMETILERIEIKVEKIDAAQQADERDLAALKNRGAGILIGVGVVAGVIGAKVSTIIGVIADALR